MTDAKVNLTFRQEKRLREVARDRNGSYFRQAKASTDRLRRLGLIELRRETPRAAGYVFVTDAGREWLQANPR